MIKTTHLRVYLPADRSGRRLPSAPVVRVPVYEGRYGLVGESMANDALVTDWRNGRYECPRTPRLRMLEGVLAVRSAYRRLGAAAVIPEAVATAARRELKDLHEEAPGLRAHILTSAWHVPIRWFIAFDPAAKEVVESGEAVSVRYRVQHEEATRRLARATRILGAASIPESIVAEVSELEGWLSGFAPDSMVELDYGTVGSMFTGAELVLDDSVADVWAAIEALAVGDWMTAGDHYTALVARWAAPMAVSYSN